MPRQTGKTTALAVELTAEGDYLALLVSCEVTRTVGDDYPAAEQIVLQGLREEAGNRRLSAELLPPDPWPAAPAGSRLGAALRAWAEQCPRPLVLFLDEIDAVQGQSLINVLTQLRNGFRNRPASFPAAVVLCGLRDVRDYKAAAGGDPSRLGTSSPFNIKVASLRLGDFTFDQVTELYGQHTAETGQEFTAEAVERAFDYTQGQPWLANPIYREVIVRVLGQHIEDIVDVEPLSFVLPDGRLDFPRLLREFAVFGKQHGEILVQREGYHEAACQLVLMGFLHRLVNGGGYIDREYGVGRGRIDLLIRWSYVDGAGNRAWQREALELNVSHPGRSDPLI